MVQREWAVLTMGRWGRRRALAPRLMYCATTLSALKMMMMIIIIIMIMAIIRRRIILGPPKHVPSPNAIAEPFNVM